MESIDRPEIHEIEPVINSDYIIGTFLQVLGLVILIIIAYCIIKLYMKVIKFLDKNS